MAVDIFFAYVDRRSMFSAWFAFKVESRHIDKNNKNRYENAIQIENCLNMTDRRRQIDGSHEQCVYSVSAICASA